VDFYSIGANAAEWKEVLLHDLPFVLLVKQRDSTSSRDS
jgi:hypothetical protein